MIKLLSLYCVVANLICFVLMGIDKANAKSGSWRIPEKTLCLAAILEGGIGGCLGMKVFRHKTKHSLFRIGFPAITAIEAVTLFLYFHTH